MGSSILAMSKLLSSLVGKPCHTTCPSTTPSRITITAAQNFRGMARVYQAPTKGATKTEENHFGERLDNTLSICYNHDYHDYHEHESDAGRGWLPNSKIARIPMMRRRNEEVVVCIM